MSYKILEKNGVDNQNVDGGAFNNFAAGGRDGIVGGVLAECALTAAGSAIGISPGLIILHGIRIKVTGIETLALSSVPLNPTSYQIIAQVTLASNGDVDFSFFIRTPQPLVQNSLYQSDIGTYQAELASFTHNPDGTISNLTKTLDIIYGSGGGDVNIEVGTVTTETLAAGLDADFDVSVRREEGTNKVLLDFDAKIPRGASGVDEGAVHFNEEQTLTDQQKKQAQDNIGLSDALKNYAKKGGKIIPVGVYPPSSAGRTLVLGTYNGEVSVGDVALIMQLFGTTDWGSYQIGDLYEITAVNSNAVTLASSAIGNIFGTSGRYRVGDYVFSDNNASPASEYGGSWEQVEGRFIFGAGISSTGVSYAVNSTGGEERVLLGIADIPDHVHPENLHIANVGSRYLIGGDGSVSGFQLAEDAVTGATGQIENTGATGGGQSHNNMPPYIAAFIWHRVS